ncbi:MAG TPA: cation diffusion facilitator family transporter [Phycisphaerae bacterium]|nr:cation diffusion facilitator family transporter [Phycisphaerae bacterium]
MRTTLIGIGVNALLALTKGAAGYFGHSYALIADAIESASDILSSLVIWIGLRMAGKPPDDNHPYGHGKFEPIAAAVVALTLLAAAVVIAVESVHEIVTPHHAPAPFTLAVLVLVVVTKETLFRFVVKVGADVRSTAVKTDAWHHRSDAITSAAAFVGILVALIGGSGYESADDFAALVASGIIAVNAVRLLRPALAELLDTAPPKEFERGVLHSAANVDGVLGTHHCRVRKLGFDLFVDLHVEVNAMSTVAEGHRIAHAVKDRIRLDNPSITDVLIHVEPATLPSRTCTTVHESPPAKT